MTTQCRMISSPLGLFDCDIPVRRRERLFVTTAERRVTSSTILPMCWARPTLPCVEEVDAIA